MKTLLAMLIFLAGCTQTPERPTITPPIEVKIPVPVRCKVDWPVPPTINLGKEVVPPVMIIQGTMIMRENEENRRYARELEILLKTCADPK